MSISIYDYRSTSGIKKRKINQGNQIITNHIKYLQNKVSIRGTGIQYQ